VQQKDRVSRPHRVVNSSTSQTEINTFVENSSNRPVFQQALLRTGEACAALEDVQRHHKQIEETVSELANLCLEVRALIEERDEAIEAT
jgi:t-SNARE complex subunit (syntaxin)